MEWIELESTAYTMVFVSSFLLVALLEGWWPRAGLRESTGPRWARHGLLFAAGAIFQAWVLRLSPLAAAWSVRDSEWGLLNRASLPLPVRFVLALLILDLVRYLTHRLFHSFTFLWRVHEIHHSDADYDISTSIRFHPLEVLGAKVIYVGAVLLLAPPLVAVFVGEMHTVLLNAAAHANVRLPGRWARALSLVFVTPDLHRIHHSLDISDQNTNFGQTFIWWDRMFGTYRDHAASDKGTGVEGIPVNEGNGAASLLAAPFRKRWNS